MTFQPNRRSFILGAAATVFAPAILHGATLTRTARWVPACNRLGMPRTVSSSNSGFLMMCGRMHQSAPVDFTSLKLAYPWVNISATLGEVAVGAGGTLACGLEVPIGTAAGTYKAFKFNGLYTGTLNDLQVLFSDEMGLWLPASTQFRLRPFISPTGFIAYGRAGLGTSGGSMSGYAGAVDDCEFAAGPTNRSQDATAITAYTSDSGMEPILFGLTTASIDSWFGVGDSILSGVNEISGTSSPAVAGAGDAVGDVGYFERAVWLRNGTYLNMAQSGSKAQIWATPGFAAIRFGLAFQYCNKGWLALGVNDLSSRNETQIIADLTTLYKQMAANLDDVRVSTIMPQNSTADSGVTFTVGANQNRLAAVNAFIRSGTVIPPSRVFDANLLVADPAHPELWTSGLSLDGTHPTSPCHATILAPAAASSI